MPMTGWLTGRFGRTRLFGVCIVAFTISSTLCGMAVSLPMMVAARVVQGFSGAFLMPMSQAFLYDMNAPSQQVRAVSIWAVGSMIGPLLGPIIGSVLISWLTAVLGTQQTLNASLVLGFILLVFVLVVPGGIVAVARRLWTAAAVTLGAVGAARRIGHEAHPEVRP